MEYATIVYSVSKILQLFRLMLVYLAFLFRHIRKKEDIIMDNIEAIRLLDKEISISYIIIIQVIINYIIIFFVKKNIFTKDNYEHQTLRNMIWHFSTLPLFFYASLIYGQVFIFNLITIIVLVGIILYTAYKISKINKKYGLLSLILSVNLIIISLFTRYICQL